MNSSSRPAASVLGPLFLSEERRDFVAMIAEVTERVANLGLGQSQGRGDRF
jgi:hypothetical protein